ncbi:MAG: response regulator transcription factor [Chloroherpetonaceae bacterium]|nr:response regulator transcription factor [Chloroherpetonaceae bacterium]
MQAKTILVADDEMTYASHLRTNLEKEGYKVIWVQSASEAINKVGIKPSALIVDLMRREQAGLDLCRQLRSMPESKHMPIIILTSRDEESDEVVSLEVGADDYIHKSASPRVVSARLRNIIRRYNSLPIQAEESETEVKIGPLEIDRKSHTITLGGKNVFMPRKEFELLWMLATNKGKVFSREMLLRRVWGENIFVTDRTVDVHVCKVRQRLGKFGQENLETIKGVGYRIKV